MGGRGRGRRGRGKRGGRGSAPSESDPPRGDALKFRIVAEADFYEKVLESENHSTTVEDASDKPGLLMQLERWSHLQALLKWFRTGIDADPSAELAFSSLLTKQHRAIIHSQVDQIGLGALEAVSRGIGEARHVSIVRHGSVPKQVDLTENQAFKAYWLRTWAVQAGIALSRGEAEEMVAGDSLTPELQALWQKNSAEQKAVDAVIEAVRKGDATALKAAVEENSAVVKKGTCDVHNTAPLHLAASLGDQAAIEVLLDAGAPINAIDGHKLSALEVSRREEHAPDGAEPHAAAADESASAKEDASNAAEDATLQIPDEAAAAAAQSPCKAATPASCSQEILDQSAK
ncbi:hypothetical protein WJX73_004201 [Symbiochloris irregularis]|uniref:Uncharacterized protein n=1 Tax=Symbiochloris irregularis TaxID=706552 RepID=A0AAW1NQU4_9CHLO